MKTTGTEILICGAGIIGLTIARELIKSGYKDIIILEKEDSIGKHASGRNSGVLHAGIYYPPHGMKARLCIRGNLLMKEYCKEKGLPICETGKVIVAKNESEIDTLKELYTRATRNGARVELIDEKQLECIEPNAKTCKTALYSYDTAVVDPKAILKSLHDELLSSKKVRILTSVEFKGIKTTNTAITDKGEIEFDTFINAAGAYSDRVAHTFGVGQAYKLIPFKGIYKRLDNKRAHLVRGNIYPVPDLRNPFLGVHFTKGVDGEVYLGPTAMPVFGRENYGGLKGIDTEAVDIFLREMVLFFSDSGFRDLAFTELRKYIHKYFFEEARGLVRGLKPEDIITSGKVGIRPQLIDWKKKHLIMDFLVIRDGNSLHILNAISPAFTSSMGFANFIVKEEINRLWKNPPKA